MQNISEIEELVRLIAKLPGLGPKSAKRIVLKLINDRDQLIKPLANVLALIYKNVSRCKKCGSLKFGKYMSGCFFKYWYKNVVPHLGAPTINKFGFFFILFLK